jgi:hypothetical protein
MHKNTALRAGLRDRNGICQAVRDAFIDAGPAGTPGPRRAPPSWEDRRELAVVRTGHPGLAPYLRAARDQLTSTGPSLRPERAPGTCGTSAPGPLLYPDAKISVVAATLGTLRQPATFVND